MRLTVIDCERKYGGYRHSVYEKSKGKLTRVFSIKFSVILPAVAADLFCLNPEKFVASIEQSE